MPSRHRKAKTGVAAEVNEVEEWEGPQGVFRLTVQLEADANLSGQ